MLVVAPTPFFADRGCHVRIYEEARLLQDLGYRVEICTYHLGRDIPGVATRRIPRVPWYKKEGPGPSYHKLYLDLLLLWTCVRAVREHRPDVIHGHLHEGALIGSLLGRMFSIPCVGDFQGSLTLELTDYGFAGNNRLLYRMLTRIEGWIDRWPDAVVASSEMLGRDLVERFRVPEDQVSLLADGVGQSWPEGPDRITRHDLQLSENHRVVVFLGVLTKLQGVEILMETIALVLDQRSDVSFLVIGFPDEKRYAAELGRRGFGDRAIFTGCMDYLKVPEALAQADLAVSPKLSETEGNGKLFNYMACALPTIVFESPVNRGILGDSGIYVQERNADAFAQAILSALDGGDEVRELGRSLQRRAQETCSWSRNGPVLEAVYTRAAEQAQAR